MRVGANYLGEGRCEFVVWAPFADKLSARIFTGGGSEFASFPMEKSEDGYWKATASGVEPGFLYAYNINGADRADPASRSQPFGIDRPSEIPEHRSFRWDDGGWRPAPLSDLLIYEIHIGAFTREGTFEAAAERLDDLKGLGVNAIELMPVAQFSGERNWGYDGVFPYAPQNTYGGPLGLKKLVSQCHSLGIAVILDVVYNHFGPEGSHVSEFGPYLTDEYRTPWGRAMNFDGQESDHVRNFFIENALYWLTDYHIDGLRLDAIHSIYDRSAYPFLKELRDRVEELSIVRGRPFYLFAESDLNDPKVISDTECGYGFDSVWCDDFHHALHALLTGEREGYYADFGTVSALARAYEEGFVYAGQYSKFRKRRFGYTSKGFSGEKFVVFAQNHDQVGNRMKGERLSSLVPFEGLKLASAATILSPYVPLIFMGEEYGEDAPFPYFMDHADQRLVEQVRRGRKEEFREFAALGEPPDPHSASTFLSSKLQWHRRAQGRHRVILEFYRTLIGLRQIVPAFKNSERQSLRASFDEKKKTLSLTRSAAGSKALMLFNFARIEASFYVSGIEGFKKKLDSADAFWDGPGTSAPERLEKEVRLTPLSLALYIREG